MKSLIPDQFAKIAWWFLVFAWIAVPNLCALTTLTVGEDDGATPGSQNIPIELRSGGNVAALQMDVLYDPATYAPGVVGAPQLSTPFVIDTHLVEPGRLRVVVHSPGNRSLPAGVFFRVPLKVLDETNSSPVVLANFILSTGLGLRIDTAVTGGVRLANLANGQKVSGKGGIGLAVETQPQIGEIAKVEYFVGQFKVGEGTGSNFSLNWLPVGSGQFEVSALVTGTNGMQTASRSLPIIVTNVGTAPIKGIYSGLIRSNPFINSQSGSATFTVTTLNTFTGKVQVGTVNYPVSGRFNADGVAEVEISRRKLLPLKLWLQLEATNLIDQIRGVITDGEIANGTATGGSFVAEIICDRLVWDRKKNAAPQRGSYTVIFGASDALPAGAPGGDGFGSVTIAGSGAIKLAGRLADGTKVSQAAWLSKDGEWPLFSTLSKSKGSSLLGELRFQDVMNVSDIDGEIHWQLADSASPINLSAVGSRYVRPKIYERALTLENVAGNALVTVEEGGLGSSWNKVVTIGSGNQVSILAPGPDALTLKLTPATGVFRGGFIRPDNGDKAVLAGAILQKQNVGSGHFLSRSGLGGVALEPNPAFAPDASKDRSQGVKPLPAIKVISPKPESRFGSPGAVSLRGTAASGAGIAAVLYQVLFDGVAGPVTSAQGKEDWTIPLVLDPHAGGDYRVFVKAVDSTGSESDLASATFTYVVFKDLVVEVVGGGAVTDGFIGTTAREVGANYKITAKPDKGRRFVGWSGGVVSASPTITFRMKANLVLQAHFE